MRGVMRIHKVSDLRIRLRNGRAGFAGRLKRAWRIARNVLRGYASGQPANESRPRKGCC
jgi:hypothetical protein